MVGTDREDAFSKRAWLDTRQKSVMLHANSDIVNLVLTLSFLCDERLCVNETSYTDMSVLSQTITTLKLLFKVLNFGINVKKYINV